LDVKKKAGAIAAKKTGLFSFAPERLFFEPISVALHCPASLSRKFFLLEA